MHVSNDSPLGYCQTCRMAKIKQDGIPICPRCDTQSATKSGLVNKCKDPGDHMDNEGNTTEPIEGGIERQSDICIPKDEVEKEPIDVVAEAVDQIDKVLCNMRMSDFADLREARKVMKYRKKLATLKLELQDFIG